MRRKDEGGGMKDEADGGTRAKHSSEISEAEMTDHPQQAESSSSVTNVSGGVNANAELMAANCFAR